MNSKPYLRVVVVEDMEMVPNSFTSLSLLVPQPHHHFLHMLFCSCVQLGKIILLFL